MHTTCWTMSRQRAAGGRIHGVDAAKHTSKAIPAPDANAELATSIQVNLACLKILCYI